MESETFLKLHFPSIPDVTRECYYSGWSNVPPFQQVQDFRAQNPDLSADIDDDEILKRYVPAPFPSQISFALKVTCWIPEFEEIIQMNQLYLLERIWDGRQVHVVDETEFAEDGSLCEYVYWIDFENKIMEITGVVKGVLTLPFKELRVGLLAELNAEYWKGVDAAAALKRAGGSTS